MTNKVTRITKNSRSHQRIYLALLDGTHGSVYLQTRTQLRLWLTERIARVDRPLFRSLRAQLY